MHIKENINWDKIKAIIFDLDGTLYSQNYVRYRILICLFIHIVKNKNGLRDFLILAHFRRNFEALSESQSLAKNQFNATANFFNLSEHLIKQVVHKWMINKPLPFIEKAKFNDVDNFFLLLKSKNIKICIFSNYPVKDKIKALKLKPDLLCYPNKYSIRHLKPHPEGILYLLKRLHIRSNQSIMIGDRENIDGLCAQKANVSFILRKNSDFYSSLLKHNKILN